MPYGVHFNSQASVLLHMQGALSMCEVPRDLPYNIAIKCIHIPCNFYICSRDTYVTSSR